MRARVQRGEGGEGKKNKTILHPACIDMRVQKIKNKKLRGEKNFSRIRAAEGRLGGGGAEGKE